MFKEQFSILFCDGDTEPRVVHHTQDGPIHVLWLETECLIHGSNEESIAVFKIGDGDVEGPEGPAEAGFSPGHVDSAAVECALEVAVFVFCVLDVC